MKGGKQGAFQVQPFSLSRATGPGLSFSRSCFCSGADLWLSFLSPFHVGAKGRREQSEGKESLLSATFAALFSSSTKFSAVCEMRGMPLLNRTSETFHTTVISAVVTCPCGDLIILAFPILRFQGGTQKTECMSSRCCMLPKAKRDAVLSLKFSLCVFPFPLLAL